MVRSELALEHYTRSALPEEVSSYSAPALGSVPQSAEILKFEPDGSSILIPCPVGNIRLQLPAPDDDPQEGASVLKAASARFMPFSSNVARHQMQLCGKTPLEQLCEGIAIEIIWEDAAAQGRKLLRQKIELGSGFFSGTHPEYHCTFGVLDITVVLHGEHGTNKALRGWSPRTSRSAA